MIEYSTPMSVALRIFDSLQDGRPFSLVRIGDGESSLLQYPKYCNSRRVLAVIRRAIDGDDFPHGTILDFQSLLKSAIRTADCVGLYSSSHPNVLSRIYLEHLEEVSFDEKALFCSPGIHFYLQQAGHLRTCIELASSVTLITGRDVIDNFRRTFPHKPVEQFLIPSEKSYRLSSEQSAAIHFPDTFNSLKKVIVGGARSLVLVGGGFLGKSYCEWAKLRGAVALDIGSVFDYWADLPTREGYLTVKNGNLELDRPILRPPMTINAPSVLENQAAMSISSVLGDHSIKQSPQNYVSKFCCDKLDKHLSEWGVDINDQNHLEKYRSVSALAVWLDEVSAQEFVLLGDPNSIFGEAVAGLAFEGRSYLKFGDGGSGVSALAVCVGISDIDASDMQEIANQMRKEARDIFFLDFRVYESLKSKIIDLQLNETDLRLTTASKYWGSSGFVSIR